MNDIVDLTSDDMEGTDTTPVNISDDEDEDLKLAIAISLQDQASSSQAFEPRDALSEKPDEAPKLAPQPMTNILGLDRRAMEAQRLDRLKRKREEVDDTQTTYASPTANRISPPPLQRRKLNKPTASQTAQKSSMGTPKFLSSANFSFPKGSVLLTSTPTRWSTSGTLEAISFPDILKPPSEPSRHALKSVLLSSFNIDFDWALPHFNTTAVKFVLVLHARDALHRQNLQQDFAGIKNVRLLMPEVSGRFGTMHSKLILLFFGGQANETKQMCRVIVPSANLVPFDWGVGGVMENVLYVVDLPVMKESPKGQGWETNFERELKKQLQAMSIPDDVLRKLDTFDFRATKDIGFVHTASGSRVIEAHGPSTVEKQRDINTLLKKKPKVATKALQLASDVQLQTSSFVPNDPGRTGLLSLSDTIASLGLSITRSSPSYPPKLDYITSSLANLSTSFIHQLYQATCGSLDPSAVMPISRRTKGIETNDKDEHFENTIKQNLSIYFPSRDTVQNSKGGQSSAGVICFEKKWWEENSLIRGSLRDCVGARGDHILMHSKILYVRFNEPLPVRTDGGEAKLYAGWAYVGSANLSESAWGRITNDAKLKKAKMTSRNWESGVIIPVSVDDLAKAGNLNDQVSKEVGYQGCQHDGTSTEDVPATFVGAQTRSENEQNCKREVSASSSTYRKQTKGGQNASDDSCTTYLENQSGEIACYDAIKNNAEDLPRGACKVRSDISGMKKLSLTEVFSKVVPVPIELPAPGHLADRKVPWFFSE